jgi:TonB family protein
MIATAIAALLSPVAANAEPLVLTVTGQRSETSYPCSDKKRDQILVNVRDVKTFRADRIKGVQNAVTTAPEEIYKQALALFARDWRYDSGDDDDIVYGLKLMEIIGERGYEPAIRYLVDMYTPDDRPCHYRGRYYSSEKAAYWQDHVAQTGGPDEWLKAARLYATTYRSSPLGRSRAFGWYSLAAQAGKVEAQKALGYMFLNDQNPDNSRVALDWFLRAAAAGDNEPFEALCDWPKAAPETVRHDAMAACLAAYRRGADLSPQSQIKLGIALFEGDGIPRDYDASWKALRPYGSADYYRGRMLAEGLGVTADPDTAWYLFRRAAKAGDTRAQDYLATHIPPPLSPAAVAEFDLNTVPAGTYSISVAVKDDAPPATDPNQAFTAALKAGGKAFYPERAASDEVEGEAVVKCAWSPSGTINHCTPLSGTPNGYGFEPAAIRLMESLKITPAQPDAWKKATAGKWTAFEVRFWLQ